jgi:phosphoglycolate phosphatase-like HAD superfamily hydrolase
MDLETMVAELERALRGAAYLDAYLLAAGIGQIADDHLHEAPHRLAQAAAYLADQDARAAGLAGAAVAATARGLGSVRRERKLIASWRRQLAPITATLARLQLGTTGDVTGLLPAGALLSAGLGSLPLPLRRAIVRLPACFQQFDQRPADIARLTERFTGTGVSRERPLLVVGVRTSGSYLAPLCAASLEALGHRRVRLLTVRPDQPSLRAERALLNAFATAGGLGLILDDPPVTGGSIEAVARRLERAGLPVTLLLQTFGPPVLPPRLRHYPSVLLGSDEWSVMADLSSAAVQRTLSELPGPGARVLRVKPVALPDVAPQRGHARRLFRVRFDGEPTERQVLVEGVGLGYLGAHRLATPALLEHYAAPVLGLRNGLLYREWLADEQRVTSLSVSEEQELASAVADYACARRRALPLGDDFSRRMAGQQPAWEVASRILSGSFGRAWPLAQVLLTDSAARQVLKVARPSVVDGNTDLAHWFRRNGSITSLIKPDVGEDRFSNLCPPCFDAAYDLAGVTALAGTPSLSHQLRAAFAELAGEAIDEERWLLYELVHLWGRERTEPSRRAELQRARARALQRYFADVYLRDVAAEPQGPLCALDIDGVLECDQLGFSGLTPASALALRALRAHGYRAVLASGRSFGEVAERCQNYGLAGGVAEYGAISFDARTGRSERLVTAAGMSALARLRSALERIDGVGLDPEFRFSVRAFSVRDGRREALSDDDVASALGAAGGGLKAIVGEDQTDFVPVEVSKAAGLRALARTVGIRGERPFAFVVGDTAADASMAEVTGCAYAPRHADPTLRQAGFSFASRPYQAGTAQAVGELLGHPPGGCRRCQMPRATSEREIVRALLAVRERGRTGAAARALELAWRTR